ncbi:zinc ribbon domain-containing protein [Mycobacterium intracellulare]|uniref:zinc ribbon domain-containing protein n=1 Tax=Mycobacterium intracellulare TaxID=1767 RepID=UPI00331609BA
MGQRGHLVGTRCPDCDAVHSPNFLAAALKSKAQLRLITSCPAGTATAWATTRRLRATLSAPQLKDLNSCRRWPSPPSDTRLSRME